MKKKNKKNKAVEKDWSRLQNKVTTLSSKGEKIYWINPSEEQKEYYQLDKVYNDWYEENPKPIRTQRQKETDRISVGIAVFLFLFIFLVASKPWLMILAGVIAIFAVVVKGLGNGSSSSNEESWHFDPSSKSPSYKINQGELFECMGKEEKELIADGYSPEQATEIAAWT